MDFKLFGYKCIIEKKIIIDTESMIDLNVDIHLFKLKGINYFVFTNVEFISFN